LNHDSAIIFIRVVFRYRFFCWRLNIVHFDIKCIFVSNNKTCGHIVLFHLFCISTNWSNILMKRGVLVPAAKLRANEIDEWIILASLKKASSITTFCIPCLNLTKSKCKCWCFILIFHRILYLRCLLLFFSVRILGRIILKWIMKFLNSFRWNLCYYKFIKF